MGRPYQNELENLKRAYEWAKARDVSVLAEAFRAADSLNLLATGSGGSLSAAHFAARLHELFTERTSRAVTPLALSNPYAALKDVCVLFLTASGRNTDILYSFHRTAAREPKKIITMCAKRNSRLGLLMRKTNTGLLEEFTLPTGKDGFLATNSLLTFAVLLHRAYELAFAGRDSLPERFERLLHPQHGRTQEFLEELSRITEPLWFKDTLIVLHGVETSVAAVDLESRFTEAAIMNLQTADFRNFAHGRHLWLAKKGGSSGVMAFVTPEMEELAEKTLRLVPKEIPVAKLRCVGEPTTASLVSLLFSIYLAGIFGRARGIDPGRPGVPDFGRKIYHLRPRGKASRVLISRRDVAIQRKASRSVANLAMRNELELWQEAYSKYVAKLEQEHFTGIALDYDGTLCSPEERFHGIGKRICSSLSAFLKAGIPIAVATGRGKSVYHDLRKKLPRRYWDRVLVGYYNGSIIETLAAAAAPTVGPLSQELRPILEELKASASIASLAAIEPRSHQISITQKTAMPELALWEIVQLIVERTRANVAVVRSSHSVDVITGHVSKVEVIGTLHQNFRLQGPILSIGDRGRWPGNDFQFLSQPNSLSVDETSADSTTCWNILPTGVRGVCGTIWYFGQCSLSRNSFTIQF